MGKLTDSITINRPPRNIRDHLEDLQRHAILDPDGFKYYRYLTRKTSGPGAKAAVLINLLGFWLPAELDVIDSTNTTVTLRATTRQVVLELKFTLEGTRQTTYVWLDTLYRRRRLPPWRIRTRIKQMLRLEGDVTVLCRRFLTTLRERLEAQEKGGDVWQETPRTSSPFGKFPIDPRREYFEV